MTRCPEWWSGDEERREPIRRIGDRAPQEPGRQAGRTGAKDPPGPVRAPSKPLYSVGHSTRSLDELLALLEEHRVEVLADVRTAPGSRRLPQFGRSSLAAALPARGLAYVHLPELGGFRKPRPDSRNTAWRNASFRGYADYMDTPEFRAGLERLVHLQLGGAGARGERAVVMMCAEAVPWRCHRSLVADALLARGVVVQHILGPGDTRPHALTPFARVDGTDTSYPGLDTLPFNG